MKALIIFLLFSLIPCFSFAECPIKETDPGRALVGYFINEDLNDDGIAEVLKVIEPHRLFHNDPIESYADDTGTVIVIFDHRGNELYWDEVNRYQEVNNILIKDTNEDGIGDVIVSVAPYEEYKATSYIYAWKDGEFQKIEDDFWIEITDDMFMSDQYILILKATNDYEKAVRLAQEASTLLDLEYDNEDIKYSKEKGIYFSEDINDPTYAGEYYPRRYAGEYISLENAAAYAGFAEQGTIIVVSGIYSKEEEALEALNKTRARYHEDAYVKKVNMWMGCIH